MVNLFTSLLILALGISLIIWFIKLLKQAIKIKAIKGFKDRFLIALLFFFGIIFSIIYLRVKINKKLKRIDKKITIKKENKTISNSKNIFKKFWHLLWKDDSLKGWAFSIIFFFVFIKFIFFPFLSLATGTVLPLAIVESCSMHHEGTIFSNFNNWWERHETKYNNLDVEEQNFKGSFLTKFKRGFTKGDILFIVGIKPEKLKIGEIIIFEANQPNPIIHRIINIKEENGELIFSTIGDNNNGQIALEKEIKEEEIIGKAVFRVVPYLGWGKLVFFEHLKPESEKGVCKEN